MYMEVGSDLVTSPVFNSTAWPPLPRGSCVIHTNPESWFDFLMAAVASPRTRGRGGYSKGQFAVYNHCLKYTKVTCQSVFTFYLCPHREDQHHSDTHFFSFILMFQAQHYFRHLKYIIWRIFKIWKCITFSTSRVQPCEKVHDYSSETIFIPEWLRQRSTRMCSCSLVYHKSKAVNVAHYLVMQC